MKNNVFGGFKLFVRKESIPLVALICAQLFILYYYHVGLVGIVLTTIFMISLGVTLRKKELNIISSLVVLSISVTLWFISIFLSVFDFITQYYYYYAISIILLWTMFNITMFIVQSGDMFASTGGILLLWGSDHEHVFLSPIILLAAFGSIIYLSWKLRELELIISLTPIALFLAYTYIMLKGTGRIAKSAFGISTLIVIYIIISNVVKFGVVGNTVFWVIIATISTLFTAQSHARIYSLEKETTKLSLVSILGVTSAIISLIIPAPQPLITFDVWRFYTILAIIPTPILAHIYLRYTGKLNYYVERNNFTLATIIKEISVTLGVKLLDQLKKQLVGQITSLFKM